MIIFGWRGRSSIEQSGLFHCPVCNARTQYVVSRSRPWFTLFFIPIFPVGSGIRAMICSGCGSILDPELANQPPDFFNPHAAGATANYMHGSSPGPVRPQFSSLAIVSLVTGCLSPVFIIACFLSFITSTVAIVTGHIALYKINRSANRLTGRAVAIVGLVFGYFSMLLTIAILAFILTRPPSNLSGDSLAGGLSTPKSRLDHAELSVMAGSKGDASHGNSELAKELATDFSLSMKRGEEELFKKNRKPVLQLSGGEYITHCELHENSCAFIVHVPSYRHFSKDAEELLAVYAWVNASVTVGNQLKVGDELAVGLRGSLTYGDILIGTYTGDDENVDYRIGSASDLIPFFDSKGKRKNDLRNLPADLAAKQPVERSAPAEPEASKGSDATPSIAPQPEVATAPIAKSPAESPPASKPLTETPAASPPPKPKPAAPAFENKIPVTLVNSIETQGVFVQSMAFIQNSDRLITGGIDEKISVFDTRSGDLRFQSERQRELNQIKSLAVSHDGRFVFAGGSTGRIASFEVKEDGKIEFVKWLYKHGRNADCIVVSPKFPFVLSGGEDGTLAWQPYDERSSSLKTLQVLKRRVLASHLFTDSSEGLATDGQDLVRFSLKNSEVIYQQKLDRSYSQLAAISPDGTRCAVSFGSELHLVDAVTGKFQKKLPKSSEMVWSILFHPTQKWLITGGNGKATVWDLDSVERIAVLDAGTIQYVTNLAITRDGKTLALIPSSSGQLIKVFDLTK